MYNKTKTKKSREEAFHSPKDKRIHANSRKLAGLIGPTLVVLSASEAINFHIWTINNPAVIYLNGALLFVAGLAILRVHHHWRGWPALVTVTGWVAIIGGLFIMFLPESEQAGENPTTYTMLAVLFLLGFFLTYKAYGQQNG